MYKLAYCDDAALEHDITQVMLDRYCEERGVAFSVDHFLSGMELIEAMKTGKEYDLCILDYIMPVMKGVELADHLRLMKYDGLIIFLSSTDEYVMDSFGVRPFYCLMKPIDPERLWKALDGALSEIDSKKVKTVVVKTDDGERNLKMSDILYVSRFDRAARYGVTGGSIYDTPKLRSAFLEAVSYITEEEGFEVFGTTVINLRKVDHISKDEIVFKDGTRYAPPAVHLKEIKARLKTLWET